MYQDYIPTPEDKKREQLRLERIHRQNQEAISNYMRQHAVRQRQQIETAIAKYYENVKGN